MSTPVLPYAQGRDIRCQIAAESSQNTLVDPVVAQSLSVMSASMEVNDDRRAPADARTVRVARRRHRGRTDFSTTLSAYLRPLAAGTPPDIGPILAAGFGVETITGGTSVAYTVQQASYTPINTVQVVYTHEDVMSRRFQGCVVERLQFNFPADGEEPSIEAELMAREHFLTGATTITEALTGGEGDVAVANIQNFQVGSLVRFAGDSNVYRVTALDSPSANDITFTPVKVGAASNGDLIAAGSNYSDDPDDAGAAEVNSLIAGTDFQVDIVTDSLTDVEFQAANVQLVNNYQRVNPAGKQYTQAWRRGRVAATGELTLWGRQDLVRFMVESARTQANPPAYVAKDLLFTAGSVGAPGQVTIEIPEAELDWANAEVPEPGGDDAVTFTLPFMAKVDNPGANPEGLIRLTAT